MGQDLLAQPFRPLPIRAINSLGRALARIGTTPIRLSDDALMRAASEQMRLSDFGPDTFRPGLARLIESIESDGRLTLFGRYFARRQLLELLTHRLQLVGYRSRHPEIADEVIRRPLFILGLPRTGTTLLYGLLAEDPANRAPLSWEIDDPCPPAETKTYQSDPRIERTQKRFAQVDALEDSMNRAGEEAAARAVPVFASAITSMSISDAFGILNGPDDAATSYFRERTSEELSNQFSPIAAEAMQKVGLYGLYQELIARYDQIPFTKPPTVDLEDYVAEMTLNALFDELAKEEIKIRTDPAARSTALLRRVFGDAGNSSR